ncbi:hypothetical protein BASA61_004508, partial [Batrachochytrium salamandrivorans]
MSLDATRTVGSLEANCTRACLVKFFPGTPETSLPVSAEQPGHNHESDTALLFSESYETDGPEDPEREAGIEKRSSSEQKFADTKSVIYDLRGNPGGDAKFADSMVQLFKPDFQPFGDRYLMNKITFDLVVNNKDPDVEPYAKAWRETKKGSRFTKVFFLNSVESANTLGQAYLRPMGVFNNGRCYSTCEVFSGSIQGHGAGTIFGEDKRTGGGGSIVMKLDPSLIHASPTTSKRQSIEDVGIKPDAVFRPQWSDLQPNPTTNTQYDRIAASLARTGQKNGQSRLHFVSEPFAFEKPIDGFSLEVEAAGIEEFTVFQADGKTVIAKQRSRATKKQKFSIPLSTVGSALGNSHITIVGKTAGKQVLKTIRNVRIIPDDDKYMKISTTGFTFQASLIPLDSTN